MTPNPGIEPGPHWWEASALTPAPSLLPIILSLSSDDGNDVGDGEFDNDDNDIDGDNDDDETAVVDISFFLCVLQETPPSIDEILTTSNGTTFYILVEPGEHGLLGTPESIKSMKTCMTFLTDAPSRHH